MGISGLLPLLKSIHKHTTLKKFAGQTIGIDGYGWLHRGAIACAIELALDKPTTKYVEFAVNRVRMLLDFGITPYVVFDGDALPSKAGTNQERRVRRKEAKQLGLQLYKAGKLSQAYQELQKATSITPYMTRQLIEELKKMDVQYVVAPYEADAQLAYLEKKGIINGVLSEDSDLLVFGVNRLITKLNQYGECVEIERKDFPLCREISLTGWTDAMFRRMAILSGCDYLPNIEKMGLKTAYRFVRKYKDAEKVIRMVAFEGKMCVPQGYLENFKNAELTFIHHRVFCPIEQKMVHLNELERGLHANDMPYLGHYVEPEIAIGVACGDLDPKTKNVMEAQAPLLGRPALKDNRRQTLGTPADLKPKKSIDSFFKPQRTPLAELDPNSLIPTPSQQRLLERNRNASWEPRPTSSAPQLRRTASALTPTPPASSVDRNAFLARASTRSSYQPPKRQRLCSEATATSPAKAEKQSRFFASSSMARSPLDRKKSKARQMKPEFDVWSDDSVDGILLGLTDVHEVATPEKHPQKAEVSAPGEITSFEVIPQSSPVQAPAEDDPTSQHTGSSSEETSQATTRTAISADNDPEVFEDLLEYHVRKQNERLARTFSFQSSAQQERALQKLKNATQSQHRTGTSVSPPASMVVSPRSPPIAATLLKTFEYQPLEVQTNALRTLQAHHSHQETIDIAQTALIQREENTDRVSPIAPTNQRRSITFHNLGSEDALVPNSEDESSGGEEVAANSRINLQKFAFEM